MLHKLKLALCCALLAALTGVAVQAILLLNAATRATTALPVAVSAELRAVDRQISRVLDGDPESGTSEGMMPLRGLVLSRLDILQASINAQVSTLQTNTDKQITGLRADLFDPERGQLAAVRNEALAHVDSALAPVSTLATELKPVLASYQKVGDETAATVKDLRDSWDSNYYDMVALLGSVDVAARGVAETAEAVGKATPEMAKSASGIATDIHRATTDFIKPRTFWQKFKAWIETAGKIGARFI